MMTAYILKSSISLLLLFGLYWFLLRKEKLFVFNRFFLVFSVIFSLIIPFISIPVNLGNKEAEDSLITAINSTIPVFAQEQSIVNIAEYQLINDTPPAPEPFSERINYQVLLLFLYLAGAGILLIRFLRNILFISRQIKTSEKIAYSGQRLVLTDKQVNPFCFLNTIFVSKQAYLNNQIAGELLNHELEHVRQAHSVDVIFIELIQILYWFNPIIILYNKAVRVNHEYLADNGVIQDSPDIMTYADKLINFVTCNRNVPLTSGFNPSLTRKRLIMLTKSRSGRINYFVRIFLTVNLAAVFFMILSFTPSYPQQSETVMDASPLTEPQSLKVKEESTVVSDAGKIQKQAIAQNKPAAQETYTGKKIIIVDGVIYNGKLNDIPIESIDVLEVISSFQATRKYGDKGKNGAVVVTTKQIAPTPVQKHQMALDDTLDKALKLIDGVEYLGKIADIPGQEIQTMSILKDKSATAVFGEKGKNGVVVITTKKSEGKEPVKISQGLVSEYQEILNRHKRILQDGKEQYNLNLNEQEKSRLEQIFFQMTKDQQSQQMFVFIPDSSMVLKRSVPTKEQMKAFLDPKMYGVWINNDRVKNEELNKYTNTDFAYVSSSKLEKNATNYGKHVYQVDLMTNEDYQKYLTKKMSETGNTLVPNKKRFEKNFTNKNLPNPVAVFHGKSSGSITRKMASETYILEAELTEPDPNIRFEILSFNMGMRVDSTDIELSSDGNKFTDEMRSMLAGLTRGKYLFIKDIKAIGPDNKVRDLSPIVLKID